MLNIEKITEQAIRNAGFHFVLSSGKILNLNPHKPKNKKIGRRIIDNTTGFPKAGSMEKIEWLKRFYDTQKQAGTEVSPFV